MREQIFYGTSTNDVLIPGVYGDPRYLHPDYLAHIEELAKYASEHGGRLKVAPPYKAWLYARHRTLINE